MLKFDYFTATPILREITFLGNSNGPKMSFLAIIEVLNFDFSKFEQLSSTKVTKISKFEVSKIAESEILGLFEFAEI